MAPPNASQDHASLADFFRILRQRRALIFLLFTLVVLTTAGVTALLPRWWLATTTIRVEKPESEVKLFQAQASSSYDPSFLEDQFKTLQSKEILHPVIENLGLGEKLGAMAGVGRPLSTAEAFDYLVNKMLRIESQRGSSIIDINVYARDARLAAAIANEIARVYAADRIDLATSGQREGLTQLQKELAEQERVVSAQRDAVEKLRRDLNISGVDLQARYSDMEIETLRQMQNSLIALSVDAIGRKTRWEQFKAIPFEQRLNLVNSELIQDSNIQSLLQAYLIADQTVTRLKARLGSAHPDFVSAVENRAKIREQLEAMLTGYEKTLQISYEEAASRVTELRQQLAQAKVDQILSARDRMRPFEEAAQKLEDETHLLTTLKLTLRQREIDFQVPKKTIEILDEAEPAPRAARPSWPLNLIFAALFGGVFAVGVAVALEFFDTSFRSVADVEDRLQLPVLGVIPFAHLPHILAEADPAAAEPYRVLQTNLNLALKPGRSASLVIFSAGPGEGKSTTLHHLAGVMAATGERVLLIDSDLRRPTQHQLARCPKAPGFADFLLNKTPFDAVIRRGISPGLDFVPAGAADGFTLSLLYVSRLRALIDELRGRYDKIVFDSPPVIGVSDAAVLASVTDAAMLLIQHRRNPQSMVLRARQILDGIRTPLLGVILNQVPGDAGDDYGYYTKNYAYYGDGHGHGKKSGKPAASAAGEKIVLTEPKG